MTKKILLGIFIPTMLLAAVVAYAQTNTGTTKKSSFDAVCVQGALDKRDTSIIASWDAYATSAKTAITTRTTALKSAWGITDATQRKTAIKKTWSDYKTAISTARKTFNQSRKTDWQKFRTDRKTCKGVNPADDATSESVDAQL